MSSSRSGAFPAPTNSGGCGGGQKGSGFCCWYPLLPPDRTPAHLHHSDRRPPSPLPLPLGLLRAPNRPHRRSFSRHRRGIKNDLLLTFLGRGFFFAEHLFRILTWPMHVTVGEEGSPSPDAATVAAEVERPTLLLRDTNKGLERAAADEARLARVRLPPPALQESKRAKPSGDGSFSLPGLEDTMTPPGFIIFPGFVEGDRDRSQPTVLRGRGISFKI
ncbi:hypothetical protein C4D60_Mb06t33670 [Musa balbisiana]|uniref:Uncharacterized protein n=1 Tax=Musa balbisiana TaxID=52838 RepID=A0A4V4H4E0_MUSBA|nr:hypothetical protein C4D60_Mb06t33670 [Musa balbisiana]